MYRKGTTRQKGQGTTSLCSSVSVSIQEAGGQTPSPTLRHPGSESSGRRAAARATGELGLLLRRPQDRRELPPLSRPARAPLQPLAGSRPRKADNRAGREHKGHVEEAGAGTGRKGAKGVLAGEGRGVRPRRWPRPLPGSRPAAPESGAGSVPAPTRCSKTLGQREKRPGWPAADLTPSTPHLLVEGVDGVHVRVAAATDPGPPVT